jgi:hypothetical protein
MNWTNVIQRLQADARKAFEEANAICRRTDANSLENAKLNTILAQIRLTEGTILNSLAAALIGGYHDYTHTDSPPTDLS